MLRHFRSRDKDGSYTIRFAITENSMLYANRMALCFIDPELWPLEVLHCGCNDFRPFLFLWPWPWSNDKTNLTAFHGDIPDVQRWISYVNVLKSYRRTDRQTDRDDRNYIRYHSASRVVSYAIYCVTL